MMDSPEGLDRLNRFLAATKQTTATLVARARMGLAAASIDEDFRILHTLEGESALFSIPTLVEGARRGQALLEPLRDGKRATQAVQSEYLALILKLQTDFESYLRDREPPLAAGDDSVSARSWLLGIDGVLRQIAAGQGKEIRPLVIEGGDLLIPESRFGGFFSRLVHVFRNAADHGIESVEERRAAGKALQGEVCARVSRDALTLKVTITDDGRGIDALTVRRGLAEKFPGHDVSSLTDAQILQKLTLPGFSLGQSPAGFSGRGVGLDALNTEVLRLGGSLRIESETGKGTVLTVNLPFIETPGVLPSAA